jgi:hypothetical protein
MKTLEREDINKVRPKFRQLVLDAWKKGEEVPYGVIYLSDAPLTEEDIAWARSLSLEGVE